MREATDGSRYVRVTDVLMSRPTSPASIAGLGQRLRPGRGGRVVERHPLVPPAPLVHAGDARQQAAREAQPLQGAAPSCSSNTVDGHRRPVPRCRRRQERDVTVAERRVACHRLVLSTGRRCAGCARRRRHAGVVARWWVRIGPAPPRRARAGPRRPRARRSVRHRLRARRRRTRSPGRLEERVHPEAAGEVRAARRSAARGWSRPCSRRARPASTAPTKIAPALRHPLGERGGADRLDLQVLRAVRVDHRRGPARGRRRARSRTAGRRSAVAHALGVHGRLHPVARAWPRPRRPARRTAVTSTAAAIGSCSAWQMRSAATCIGVRGAVGQDGDLGGTRLGVDADDARAPAAWPPRRRRCPDR